MFFFCCQLILFLNILVKISGYVVSGGGGNLQGESSRTAWLDSSRLQSYGALNFVQFLKHPVGILFSKAVLQSSFYTL